MYFTLLLLLTLHLLHALHLFLTLQATLGLNHTRFLFTSASKTVVHLTLFELLKLLLKARHLLRTLLHVLAQLFLFLRGKLLLFGLQIMSILLTLESVINVPKWPSPFRSFLPCKNVFVGEYI